MNYLLIEYITYGWNLRTFIEPIGLTYSRTLELIRAKGTLKSY